MLNCVTATWPEVAAHIVRQPIAVLAFGAQEQHGAHLPLSTDTLLAGELARRLATELDALLLPSIPYGETWSTSGYPGTVTIGFATVEALLVDIGRSIQAQGVRALIVVNGHFSNHAPLEQAARRLLDECAFSVLLLDYPGLAQLADTICESQPAAPTFYHADEVETSLLLVSDPALVHMDRAAAEYPVFPETFGAQPMRLDTFCVSGVFGDPRPATVDKGERLYAGLVANCLPVIDTYLAGLD
jgi:creatinine amidohydrolase